MVYRALIIRPYFRGGGGGYVRGGGVKLTSHHFSAFKVRDAKTSKTCAAKI